MLLQKSLSRRLNLLACSLLMCSLLVRERCANASPADERTPAIVELRAKPRRTSPALAATLLDGVLADTVGAGRARFRYEHAMVGFAAPLSDAEIADLRAHPLVLRVVKDASCSFVGSSAEPPTGPNNPVPWALRRVSDPNGLAPDFDPCGATGKGVTVVLIDSGIALEHTEFAGRIVTAMSFSGVEGGRDTVGHGTHVAGCAAGASVGVAPGASIMALGTSSESGQFQLSAALAAINWIAKPGNVPLPAVVNCSFGSNIDPEELPTWRLAEAALAELQFRGFVTVVSAGNDSWPSSWKYPAASAFALNVGSTDVDDQPSLFSNHGPLVSLWAPGTTILSADWKRPQGGLKFMSGTSQSAPIVSGVAALHLERHPPTADELRSPVNIATRARLALVASAARGELHDVVDPVRAIVGGHGVLAGAANRVVQACDAPAPLICTDAGSWNGQSRSIVLGDGITPIDASFRCVRNVRHPSGPVHVTVNACSPWIDARGSGSSRAVVRITDAASGALLWDSDSFFFGEPGDQLALRMISSSSAAGVDIAWESTVASGPVGFGYALTATYGSTGGGQATCSGDLDGSGSVDGTDLAIVLGAWGQCDTSAGACIADLNLDGEVDGTDLGALVEAWGPCTATDYPGMMRDCDGNLVLRIWQGDSTADFGSPVPDGRRIWPFPLNQSGLSSSVNLACAELNWDLDAGGRFPMIIESDLRAAACASGTGQCVQTDRLACLQAQGFFLGLGHECGQEPVAPTSVLAGCPSGALTLGFPIAGLGSDFNGIASDAIMIRQPVPQGLRSISRLSLLGSARANVQSKAQDGPAAGREFYPGTSAARIIVWFRDGGAPSVIDRPALMRVIPAQVLPGQSVHEFVMDGVLAPSDREVLSVAVLVKPDGADCLSTLTIFTQAGKAVQADDVGACDFSPDGGATWLPAVLDGGARFQSAMCIVP